LRRRSARRGAERTPSTTGSSGDSQMPNAHIEIANKGMISALIHWLRARFRSRGINTNWISCRIMRREGSSLLRELSYTNSSQSQHCACFCSSSPVLDLTSPPNSPCQELDHPPRNKKLRAVAAFICNGCSILQTFDLSERVIRGRQCCSGSSIKAEDLNES
jgi:hypothetical protein